MRPSLRSTRDVVASVPRPAGAAVRRLVFMHKRKLLIALATAGFMSAGFGASVLPASADPRVLLVTLQSGEQRTVTVDLPAGADVSGIQIPGINEPIVSVQEVSAPAPAPTTPAQPDPQPSTTTTQPAPAPTSSTPAPAPADPPAPAPAQEQPAPAAPAPAAPAPAAKPQTTSREKAARKSAAKKRAEKEAADRLAEKQGKPATDDADADQAPAAKPEGRQQTTGTEPHPKVETTTTAPIAPTGAAAPATDASASLATTLDGFSPTTVGVPNFFIDRFRIPPFLLPIYQAAGIQYGVRWEVLAAINEVETDYGRNLNVSTAGALGWMQFMPATWQSYGVDANQDGERDPFNPVDAIFAAARYLKAAGAEKDVRRAVWAYNHADWYVDDVMKRAQLIAAMPTDLVSSLSGLTQGHFPVAAHATYDDQVTARDAKKVAAGQNAANPVVSNAAPQGHRHPRPGGLPRRRGRRRDDHLGRPQRSPRQLRQAARRLRQRLHVRAPEEGLARGPRAQAEASERGERQARARTRQEGPRPDPRRDRRPPDPHEPDRREEAAPPRRSARSACSPTRGAPGPGPQAAAPRWPTRVPRCRRTPRWRATSRSTTAWTATT